jgi:hypothetical protein
VLGGADAAGALGQRAESIFEPIGHGAIPDRARIKRPE